jgi:hypothetical protein
MDRLDIAYLLIALMVGAVATTIFVIRHQRAKEVTARSAPIGRYKGE